MTRSAKVTLGAGLVFIALAVAVFAGRFGINVQQGISPVIGAPTPDVVLPVLGSDDEVSLAAVDEGSEIVIVNFFASWCLQCRFEHPDLIATADAYADRGVSMLGIAFQNADDQAIAFLDELGWGESSVYLADPGSRAAIEFGVFGIPETIFIRDGVIVGKLIGQSDALTLTTTIERILAGEAVGSQQVGEYQQRPGG